MSVPQFLPLACPRCSDNLAGRAVDRLAFCRSCRRAYRIGDGVLSDLPSRHVTDVPPGPGARLALPFWLSGTLAMPAFLGARPLSVARIATRALVRWSPVEGLGIETPLGARVPPAALTPVCRLARLPLPAGDAPVEVLSVPVRADGGRFLLPAGAGTLYPDDVQEGRLLAEMAQPSA